MYDEPTMKKKCKDNRRNRNDIEGAEKEETLLLSAADSDDLLAAIRNEEDPSASISALFGDDTPKRARKGKWANKK